MNRQQKRAASRAAKKLLTRRVVTTQPLDVPTVPQPVLEFRGSHLSDRQRRGYELWHRSQTRNGMSLVFEEDTTIWFSASENNRAYHVTRILRNIRGSMEIVFRCTCDDFKRHGRTDCKHIFAEKLRRELVVVKGPIKKVSRCNAKAKRRPARKRKAYDGASIRTSQRRARVAMPARIPELIHSVSKAFSFRSRGIVIPLRAEARGRKGTPLETRAAALLAKIAIGVSADEMVEPYKRMIEAGTLCLKEPPHANTLTQWINDERLTPILHEFLRLTSEPFREREIGAIIDSSKVSQLMIAHSKEVDYNNHDKRPTADWMKCHAIVGVETLVVMAAEFSGALGNSTHDINYLKSLIMAAEQTFRLDFLLGDKAYLSEGVLRWLWEHSIKATIPVKKGWFKGDDYHEAVTRLVEWYDRNSNRDFHEFYRLRPKIEGLFSLLKRMTSGFCLARGRKRKIKNMEQPCTAWINETLCKFIYLNLRTTVTLEHETGFLIDYLIPSRRFPPPDEPLLKRAA